MTSTTAPGAERRYRPVSLENLWRISRREHAAARDVIARVQALINWRDEHAAQLDPATDMPAGNWRRDHEHKDFMDAVRLVAAGKYATINHLRYYTNTLVGGKLLYFCPNTGMSSVMPVPAKPRAVVAENLHRLDSQIAEYLRMKAAFPAELLIKPPWKLGEVGTRVDGVIVNQDTVRQQATILTLWRTGVLNHLRDKVSQKGTAHVVEIGAGHGSLCYHLKRLLPKLTYTILDLPETLMFSGIYLAVTARKWRPTVADPVAGPTCKPFGIHLAANFQFGQVLSRLPEVDLAVNISSFGEMTPAQVDKYAAGLSAAMAGDGLLFETNELNQAHIQARASEILAKRFAHRHRAFVPDVLQFEGATWIYAHRPVVSIIEAVRAPRPRPTSPLRILWDCFRRRPLYELAVRLARKMLRSVGVWPSGQNTST